MFNKKFPHDSANKRYCCAICWKETINKYSIPPNKEWIICKVCHVLYTNGEVPKHFSYGTIIINSNPFSRYMNDKRLKLPTRDIDRCSIPHTAISYYTDLFKIMDNDKIRNAFYYYLPEMLKRIIKLYDHRALWCFFINDMMKPSNSNRIMFRDIKFLTLNLFILTAMIETNSNLRGRMKKYNLKLANKCNEFLGEIYKYLRKGVIYKYKTLYGGKIKRKLALSHRSCAFDTTIICVS